MVDFVAIGNFLKDGAIYVGSAGILFGFLIGAVKYANRDLEREVDNIKNEVDTIKNNHIVHLNKDIQELKEGQRNLDLKIDKTNEKIEKIKSDVSYIKGMLEILVKDKK
jgi:peptidoglycan hydrolase CwlO-like protein